jgi:WD40 repeat protein/transcriptional regulator with XRE-family HTH domain
MDDPRSAEMPGESPEACFGAELRGLRVRAGLSVRQLAEALYRAHSSIVGYESGRRLAGVEVVEQYEDYFGLVRGTLVARRERARAARLEVPHDATVDENLGDIACPYKGLLAFEDDDAALFFGRETQVVRVLTRLGEVRFVAVIGASGSGKSSFLRAGLLAGIDATALTGATGATIARVALLTPGEHPLDELAGAVSAATGGGAPVLGDELRADPNTLERATRHAGDAGLVIVVDQFEELFTLCDDDAERRCFVDALFGAWRDPTSPVVVILALRADFYGHVAAYPQLAATVVAHQALISPMSPADLRRAIEMPAAATGLLLQPGLAETMLEDLADEPGALPLLSHALFETWKRRRRLMLTVGGYHEAGGVRGAIAQTAERTLQSLPEADRAIARSIFLRLTDVAETSEPTRRRADRSELPARPQTDRVLGVLADARLVTIDERTVTLAHEALIGRWPRLRGWIDADRAGLLTHRRLTDAARQWDTLKRENAALYRGARLVAAREWTTAHADQLSQLERDFLAASQAAEHGELEAATRRARRLRALATGLATLTVIVAVLAVWALGQRAQAQHERLATQRQASVARSLALASSASALLHSRPDISLLLGLEAYRTSPRVEARSSLLAGLIAARDHGVRAMLHGHASSVDRVAFSPDGRTLASASADTIRLWDTRTHKQLGMALRGHTHAVTSVAFSADGRTLTSGSLDRTIRVWDVRTHKQLGAPLNVQRSTNIELSPDGRTASVSYAKTIRLWDVPSHKQLGAPLTGGGLSVAFSPDGRTLASGGEREGTIRLWDVHTHKPLGATLTTHTSSVYGVAFTSDGRTLASASADNTVRLWDMRTHKQLGAPLTAHTGYVSGVAFSPDGRTLASAGDRTIGLWDVRTHKSLGPRLSGHTRAVNSLAFSPNGHTLASASEDSTIRLWAVRTHTRLDRTLAHDKPFVESATFSPDARILATFEQHGTNRAIRLRDALTGKQLGAPLVMFTARRTDGVDMIDVNMPFGVDMTFSADSHRLATTRGGLTQVWDVSTHKQLGTALSTHSPLRTGAAFSPDGRTLASASHDGIRLFDLRTHKQLGPLMIDRAALQPRSLAFSPDGRTLAITNASAIHLWDALTHRPRAQPLRGHTSAVYSVTFSPDGRTLASTSEDQTLRLWDVRTHKQLRGPLTGQRNVAFTPDGRTLASTSEDQTLRLWDVRTHKQIGIPLITRTSQPAAVVFRRDGRTLLTARRDATVQSWTDLLWRTNAELQTDVCNLVANGLSNSEWAQYTAVTPYRHSCP